MTPVLHLGREAGNGHFVSVYVPPLKKTLKCLKQSERQSSESTCFEIPAASDLY